MVLLVIQFGLAFTVLLFSAFIVWFEGRSFSLRGDWQASPALSYTDVAQTQSSHEVFQLSNWVHAVKFQPFFLVTLTISALYLLVLIGYVFLKKRSKWLTVYLAIFGIGFLTLSYFPNVQYVFSRLFLASGLIFILMAQLSYFDVFSD